MQVGLIGLLINLWPRGAALRLLISQSLVVCFDELGGCIFMHFLEVYVFCGLHRLKDHLLHQEVTETVPFLLVPIVSS